MRCNYCGTEIERTPCLNCFPMYKCRICGTITKPISLPHKRPDGQWCDNPVRGFGDTRADKCWLVIDEDNYKEEGFKK